VSTGPSILRWTGHALIDVGIAGLCAFSERARPADLTLEDLDAAAAFMEERYYDGKLLTYLTCVFMNSSFVQPSESADKRASFIRQYLRAHRAEPSPDVAGRRCVFSGEPAVSPLVRTHFPLFSGEGVMNFRPSPQTAVPAAGPYVVALMFLPMASRRAEGRLLAVHADDPELTLHFARIYLEDNQRLLQLALPDERAAVHAGYDRELPMWDAAKKRHKFADVKAPRSLVVSDLTSIAERAAPTWEREHGASLTAYLLSNSGQGPSLDIFQVSSGAVAFVLHAASLVTTRAEWKAIAERFYALRAADDDDGKRARPRAKAAQAIPGRAGWTRNPAFEDLCAIYDAGYTDRTAAAGWLRRYVLGRIEQKAGTARYEETRARSWALADLFLKEVMAMKKARVDAIRAFADKLAGWIHGKTDKKLRNAVFFDEPWRLRHALMRAQRESLAGDKLLFGLDEYAEVWLHEDGDERLVRDLIAIRLVEKLSELGEKPDEMFQREKDEEEQMKEGAQ
jgi:CRISPR-associated protein Cst1